MNDHDVTFITLDRDTDERFHALRRELGVTGFGINLMVFRPGERGRIHAHEQQEEVYLVLEGELTLAIEGEDEQRILRPDDMARVGHAVRRRLSNASRERLVVLALGSAGQHIGRDGKAWTSWDEGGAGRPPQEVPLPGDLPPG